jgi:hypothetical protein
MTKLTEKRTLMTPSGVMLIINDENFVASGSSIAGQTLDARSPNNDTRNKNNKVCTNTTTSMHHFIYSREGE